MSMILASASPRRRDLLLRAGARDLRVIPSDADETVPEGATPKEAVVLLAERKARACMRKAGPGDVVVAADTVVYLDGVLLGKPKDKGDARRMLALLSGRRHEVYTGVCAAKGGKLLRGCQRTSVWFRRLSAREIDAYVETGEPMDKAGAYGIQERGSLLVSRIHGDYFNVMGLPLCRLNGLLARLGESLL